MNRNEITITISAKDATGPGFKSAKDGASDVETRMLGMAKNVGIAVAAAGAAGVAAASALAVSSVRMAADYEESLNKVRAVFGNLSGSVEAFASNSARDFGLAQGATLEYLGTFGNLLTSMGLSQNASAQMSEKIVQLSADFASFNNIPVPEALEKIRAGLVGETEPLRALGVNLNDAALKSEAMRMGLIKQGEEMSAATKAQAAYSLILQQSKNAQGDFARTSDSLSNQQKILGASVDDLQVKFGRALLPIVQDVTTDLNELVAIHGDEWAYQFARGVDQLAGAFRAAADRGGDLVEMLGKIDNFGGLKSQGKGGNISEFFQSIFGINAVQGINDVLKNGPAWWSGTDAVNARFQTEPANNRESRFGPGTGPLVNEELAAQWAQNVHDAAEIAFAPERIAAPMNAAGKAVKSAVEEMAEKVAAATQRHYDDQEQQIRLKFATEGKVAADALAEQFRVQNETWEQIKRNAIDNGYALTDIDRAAWEQRIEENKAANKRMNEENEEAFKKLADIQKGILEDQVRDFTNARATLIGSMSNSAVQEDLQNMAANGLVLYRDQHGNQWGAAPGGSTHPNGFGSPGQVLLDPSLIYGSLPKAATGGYVAETGAAVIHKGEHIIPAGQGGGITVNFNGPVYGIHDLEDVITRTVRDAYPHVARGGS